MDGNHQHSHNYPVIPVSIHSLSHSLSENSHCYGKHLSSPPVSTIFLSVCLSFIPLKIVKNSNSLCLFATCIKPEQKI
jgi:hypothetical protein